MRKTVLITGVTSGLGLALAKEFSKQGHTVVGCGRRQETIDVLQHEFGHSHLFSALDVSDDAKVRRWAEQVHAQYDKMDIVINNAAITGVLSTLWESKAEDFAQVLNINVSGTANVIRHFVPHMQAANSGTIVNLSSEWGRTADAYVAAYCASKFAIEGLTKALAKELPSKMVTIALSPLIVWTNSLEKCRHLLLPGEYELGVYPHTWAQFVVPKIMALKRANNGAYFTWSPNFQEWVVPQP
jgi:NAD(P)-dependent dehydrogenase (short-subunit alcohol dehydrogenase family)